MSKVREGASRLGSRVGNWNDRRSTHDVGSEASRFYRAVNRVASWLYVRPDRKRRA